MSDDAATATPTVPETQAADFEAVERTLREQGADAALGQLVASLAGREEPRALLDALLLQARHELGLPAVLDGSLTELPEPQRTKYEDRYVEAIRRVGTKLLESGDLIGAWPYFRAIGEKEPVAKVDRRLPADRE